MSYTPYTVSQRSFVSFGLLLSCNCVEEWYMNPYAHSIPYLQKLKMEREGLMISSWRNCSCFWKCFSHWAFSYLKFFLLNSSFWSLWSFFLGSHWTIQKKACILEDYSRAPPFVVAEWRTNRFLKRSCQTSRYKGGRPFFEKLSLLSFLTPYLPTLNLRLDIAVVNLVDIFTKDSILLVRSEQQITEFQKFSFLLQFKIFLLRL